MKIPLELSKKAISLEHVGLHEVAWFREDAFRLLDHFESEGNFVLGGDVLTLTPGGYRHNGSNWYFNFEDGDAQQSIEYTRSYIQKYPAGNYAFVLVSRCPDDIPLDLGKLEGENEQLARPWWKRLLGIE